MLNKDFVIEVIRVVEKAATFIAQSHGQVQSGDIVIKDLNSLVSYVDINSEKILVEGLKTILPQSAFLTEEGTEAISESDWVWIIDPLDGTTNFLHQIPVYAISIALQYRNEIVFGLVYEVNKEECFYAIKDQGAFLNGHSIQVKESEFSDTLIATGFPYYDFSKTPGYLNVLEYLMQNTRGVRRLGAAAVDLAYVACGRFNGFYEYSLAPWDVAAGALIVKEAGGVVTDFTGKQDWLFGKSIVVGASSVHQKLLDKIQIHMLK